LVFNGTENLNGLLCADVPLTNYSFIHSLTVLSMLTWAYCPV